MSEDSKKRQEYKKQIASKAQTADIKLVEKVANILNHPKNWEIVERASIMPVGSKNEISKFIICFDYLSWSQCVFTQFDQAKGRKLVEILEQVSKCEINRFSELRLVRDSIGRKAPYDSLFLHLSPDVTELKETELCDGRLFFYIIEPYFNIISVETNHRNVDN